MKKIFIFSFLVSATTLYCIAQKNSGLGGTSLSPIGGSSNVGTNQFINTPNGTGSNIAFQGTTKLYAPTNIYGSLGDIINLYGPTGPGFDGYNTQFRFFGSSLGYQFWDQLGNNRLFRIDTQMARNGQESGKQIPTATASTSTDYPANTYVNFYSQFLGGDVSATTGNPMGIRDAIWGRAPYPPVVYSTWFLDQAQIKNSQREQMATNAIRILWTNIVPWLALVNHKPSLEIEAWSYTNANRLLNRDSSGNIWWDTNKFPDGIPFICNYGHTNGVNVGLQEYYDTVFPQTSVYENAAGVGVVTTPKEVVVDVKQIGSWGVDFIRVADTSVGPYFTQLMRQWSEQILTPDFKTITVPGGLQAGYFSPTVTNQLYLEMDYNGGTIPPDLPSGINALIWDVPYTGGSSSSTLVEAMYEARATYTNVVKTIGKGHYTSGQLIGDTGPNNANLTNAQINFTMGANFCAEIQIGNNTNPPATWLQAFTNVDMLKIYFDDAQMPAVRIYDTGSNGVSCWAKPLANGDIAITLVNETASTTNLGFSFTQINSSGSYYPPIGSLQPWFSMDTNRTWQVYDVWARAQQSTNYVLTFTNSFPAKTFGFYRFSPVYTIATMFQGNSGGVPLPAATTSFYAVTGGNSQTNLQSADVSSFTRNVTTRQLNLRNLYVTRDVAGGVGHTTTVTVMTNGVATSIVVSLVNATTGNDTTHSVTIPAGTEVGLKIITPASDTPGRHSWALEAGQ